MVDLPVYQHIVEVSVEHAEGLDVSWRLLLLVKALHQLERSGTIRDVISHDIKDDRLEILLETTCPPHTLGTAQVVFRFRQSKLVSGSDSSLQP